MTKRIHRHTESDPFMDAERIMRFNEVAALLGIHVVTVHRYVEQGILPPPMRIARNVVGWRAKHLIKRLDELEARGYEPRDVCNKKTQNGRQT